MSRINVVALIAGEPHGQELWTLRSMSTVPCELRVVQALHQSTVSRRKRALRQIRQYGLFESLSRWAGQLLLGAREERRTQWILDELFDFQNLREWWDRCSIGPVQVPSLNHQDCRAMLEKIAPDVIVCVSGGIPKPHIFSQARLATLNINHGIAPLIRGVSSIPCAIIENRREWIGGTIHVIDEGIYTGTVLWRGGPQLAPGDTDVTILFRTHLQAVEALVRILKEYARGGTPKSWSNPAGETSAYRSALGLGAWLNFLFVGRGRRAHALLERALQC